MVDLSDMRKAEKNRERVAKSRMLNTVKSKEDTKKAVAKYRKENPEKIKEDRRISMAKSRQCKDEMDRLIQRGHHVWTNLCLCVLPYQMF